MRNAFVSTVREEDGEYFIEIPEEILRQVNWVAGDIVEWTLNENKEITINKILSYSKEVSTNDG